MSNKLLEAYLVRPQICPNPVFIIGSPRSGTTALALALAQHSQLWTSGESYILHDLFGDGKADKIFKRAAELSDGSWLKAEQVDRSEFVGFLGLGVNALFSSRSQGKRWVDQTPHYALMGETLAEMFPGAFFIHILRDGRRVVHSMKSFRRRFTDESKVAELIKSGSLAPWATDFGAACRTWRRYVDASMALCAKHPTRCLTVINEELVASPRQWFSEIFRLLGIAYEEQPVEFLSTHRVNSSFSQQYTGQPPPVDKESIPWHEWDSDQKDVFIKEAGPTLIKLGFATEAELNYSSYDEVVKRTREAVGRVLPPDATVIAVNKGDGHLLNSDGPKLWHFPQAEDGTYAGYHPADSAEAIDHLERLRAKGGNFLLIPSTAFWWLDHYFEFRQHLEQNYQPLVRDEACVIFALNRPETERSNGREEVSPFGLSTSSQTST